jgi:CRP/FNR family cyclic AMP-dependent transcriptional regulator
VTGFADHRNDEAAQGRKQTRDDGMKERFEGPERIDAAVDALKAATIVRGDDALATAIAKAGHAIDLTKDQLLINEDGVDTDLFFLLAGKARIEVKGVEVNQRGPGDHVGEIAALDPTQRRAASVVITESGVAWKLPEPALTQIAKDHPDIWRRLAIEQAKRLVQRNALVRPANAAPKVFVISSSEAVEIANEIQLGLAHSGALVIPWSQGVFRTSEYTIESLQRMVEQCDFAIAVIAADDVTLSRDRLHLAARDNVTFELGLFMGELGLRRTILVEQRDAQVELCSDLRGITTLTYTAGSEEDLSARMGPVCTQISRHIKRIGVRR